MARLFTTFEDNFALTYPHNNSFTASGDALILGRIMDDEVGLWKCSIEGKRAELCRFKREPQPEKLLWSDTAREADVTVTVADNRIWLLDPGQPGSEPRLLAAPADYIHPLVSLNANGTEIVGAMKRAHGYAAFKLEVATGEMRILFEKPWWINHVHFSPFDPAWIGFCHEGRCFDVMDRIWGWHAREAPQGRCIFDQRIMHPDQTTYAGHERWSFQDRSVLTVTYGEGPGRPRGIFEAFTDGRSQRLISEGDRDFHLDESRDGRWIVVDTTGPHDAPGTGWENAGLISDILAIDRSTGERRFIARSRMARHPSHAHPVLSPDGRQIYFNEASEDGSRNRVWCADNPFL